MAGAVALALLSTLLQVLALAQGSPAAAAVENYTAATFNMQNQDRWDARWTKGGGNLEATLLLSEYAPQVVALQEMKSTAPCDPARQEEQLIRAQTLAGTETPRDWRVTKCTTPFTVATGYDLFFLAIENGNATRNIGFVVDHALNIPLDDASVHVIGRAVDAVGNPIGDAPKPMLGLKLGGDTWFYSVHGANNTNDRGDTANRIDAARTDAGGLSWTVLGDFNRRAGSWRAGDLRGTEHVVAPDVHTYPVAPAPEKTLDYAITSDTSPAYEAWRLNDLHSDHHAVWFGPACAPTVTTTTARAAGPGRACRPRESAVVSMGDSYISGEAGRWQGNANTEATGDVWGTDRSAGGTQGQVYEKGSESGGGCHRSDVAEVRSADIKGVPAAQRFNIACSGATTKDVVSDSFKGEKPQVEQLAEIAARQRVSAVVLSVGGNDLRFGEILTACAKSYLTPGAKACKDTEDAGFRERLGEVRSKVTGALKAIRRTMSAAGRAENSYRLVLQSYPSPLPSGDAYRYPQDLVDYSRYDKGGCPFRDVDSDWARRSLVPEITTMLRGAAREGAASFLDVQDAFAGHELCAKTARQADSGNSLQNPVPAQDAEWVRWVPFLPGWTDRGPRAQGDVEEAVHPNAYGQRALGACLSRMLGSPDGANSEYRCTGSAGQSPGEPTGEPVRRGIDSTLSVAKNEAYFFNGSKYARVKFTAHKSEIVDGAAGVKDIGANWPSLRGTPFAHKVDAAFSLPESPQEAFMFSGDQYIRIKNVKPGTTDDTRVNGPWPLCTGWTSLCATPELKRLFADGIDSALSVRENEVFFFKGDQYVRVQVNPGGIDKVLKGPLPIADHWPSLKDAAEQAPAAGFTSAIDASFGAPEWYCSWLDAILSLGLACIGNHPGNAAVFSGGQYALTSLKPDTNDDRLLSGPSRITDVWTSLRDTVFDERPAPMTGRLSRNGPTPAADPEPNGPGPWSTDPAAQPKCRPDGMTATAGVNTPYCRIYDDQGRERMGERHPRRVVGYFTGWRTGRGGQPMYLPGSIPWGQVSHVNYAFAHVDDAQRISVGDVNSPDNPATGMTWPGVPRAEMDESLPYKGNFNLLTQYKKKHPRVKTLISVGGWAETGGVLNPDGSRSKSGGLYKLTTNEDGSVNQSGIDTFADSVVDFLRTYGFDGVDIDYEYPTSLKDAGNPEDWPVANARRKGLNAGNTALMKTLREKLDAASEKDSAYYQLTAAASSSGYLLRGQEDFRALQYLDFVNSMSYDFHGSWNSFVGPQAPLYDDGKDGELTAAGTYDRVKNPEYDQEGYFNTDWSYHYFRGALQAGRINLGVPYYTRGWKNVTGGSGNGLWGRADLPDQSQCPDGTGPKGGTTPCGSGASGIDNLWHDQTAAGDELASGSSPMWHAKNLERGVKPGYLPQFGLDPKDPGSDAGGYSRHWDDTLKASWLWNDDKKVYLSTQDTQDVTAKADYIKDKGAGGAMIWELAGDYECPADESEQCGPGYTLTKELDDRLRDSGPYGNTRAGSTELPRQVLDLDVEFADYPTDNKELWPLQPKLRITNRGNRAVSGGAKVSFDLPTSAPPVVKDGGWQLYPDIEPGHSGPNAGGLKGDFHRVTITLEACQEIPAGRSVDIPVKYYLPATGPANVTVTTEGQTFGITGDKRHGTETAEAPAATNPCQVTPWTPDADHYTKGDVVTHNNRRWVAQYWADKGAEPGTAPVWRDISPND